MVKNIRNAKYICPSKRALKKSCSCDWLILNVHAKVKIAQFFIPFTAEYFFLCHFLPEFQPKFRDSRMMCNAIWDTNSKDSNFSPCGSTVCFLHCQCHYLLLAHHTVFSNLTAMWFDCFFRICKFLEKPEPHVTKSRLASVVSIKFHFFEALFFVYS